MSSNLPSLFEDSDLSGLPLVDPGDGRPWRKGLGTGTLLATGNVTDDIATVNYVDDELTNGLSTRLPLAGGTLTGNLTVNANVGIGINPTAPLHISSSYAVTNYATMPFVNWVNTNNSATQGHCNFRLDTINATASVGFVFANGGTIKWDWLVYGTPANLVIRDAANGYATALHLLAGTGLGVGRVPTCRLDVQGDGRFTGSVAAGVNVAALNYAGAGLKLVGSSDIEFAPTNIDTAADLILIRKAVGQLDVRGDSGLRVRNLANTADSALACGNLTASGSFSLGNTSSALIRDNAGNFEVCSFSATPLATFRNTGVTLLVPMAPNAAGTVNLAAPTLPWQHFYQRGEWQNYNAGFAGNTNFERGFQRWNSNVYEIGAESGGTGVARDVRLVRSGATAIQLSGAGFVVQGFTFATVPIASANAGATIRITDRSNRLATSDGTNWNWAGTTTPIT